MPPSFRNTVPLDFGLIFISGLLAYYFVFGTGLAYSIGAATLPWFIGLAFVVKPVSLVAVRLYSDAPGRVSMGYIARCALAVLASALAIGLAIVLLKPGQPRLLQLLLVDGLVTFAGVIAARALVWFLYRVPEKPEGVTSWVLTSAFGAEFTPKRSVTTCPWLFYWRLILFGIIPMQGQPCRSVVRGKRWWGELPHSFYGVPTVGERELLGLDRNGGWSFFLTPVWSLNRFLDNAIKP